MTPANKGQQYEAEVLTRAEVEALLDACKGTPQGLCQRAMFTLMWRAGLRCNEVLQINLADLDLERARLRVMWPKGRKRKQIRTLKHRSPSCVKDRAKRRTKPRGVLLDDLAMDAIEAWLAVRGEGAPSDPLFTTPRSGARIPSQRIRVWMPLLAKRAGIERRVHAHILRHTFAYELAMEGKPMIVIAAALGQARVTTTERYVAHLAGDTLLESLRGRN